MDAFGRTLLVRLSVYQRPIRPSTSPAAAPTEHRQSGNAADYCAAADWFASPDGVLWVHAGLLFLGAAVPAVQKRVVLESNGHSSG